MHAGVDPCVEARLPGVHQPATQHYVDRLHADVETVQSCTDEVDDFRSEPVDKTHRHGVTRVGRRKHHRCELDQPRL